MEPLRIWDIFLYRSYLPVCPNLAGTYGTASLSSEFRAHQAPDHQEQLERIQGYIVGLGFVNQTII